MKKILLTGVVGGLVMFIWGAIAHVVLPIGTMGLKTLSNEDAVIGPMKQAVPESGLYFFPGMDLSRKPTEAEQRAWEAKYEAGPTGLLLYTAHGSKPMSPQQLLSELVKDILAALILASVFSRLTGSVGCRALTGALLGLFAWLSISGSYWIWYHFPAAFTIGEGLDQTIGWCLAGAVQGWLLRSKPPASTPLVTSA
jgi:hypothetical protein